MTLTRVDKTVRVSVQDYDTPELPAKFDLEPSHSVELPNNWWVHIYPDEQWLEGICEVVEGWRLVLVESTGYTPKHLRLGRFFNNPLDVMLQIRYWSQATMQRLITVEETIIPTIEADD